MNADWTHRESGQRVIESSGQRKARDEEEAMKICAKKQDSKLPCSTEEHKGKLKQEAKATPFGREFTRTNANFGKNWGKLVIG